MGVGHIAFSVDSSYNWREFIKCCVPWHIILRDGGGTPSMCVYIRACLGLPIGCGRNFTIFKKSSLQRRCGIFLRHVEPPRPVPDGNPHALLGRCAISGSAVGE